ncbi:MAG: hypothetical protein IPK87_10565 [Planctomycetes bacterium]|nr:hypothetical protein [Planctomycetota bacterium]
MNNQPGGCGCGGVSKPTSYANEDTSNPVSDAGGSLESASKAAIEAVEVANPGANGEHSSRPTTLAQARVPLPDGETMSAM